MSKDIEELTADFRADIFIENKELGSLKKQTRIFKIPPPPNNDITIKCVACSKDFIFSFLKFLEYKNKGWVQPKSCPSCVEYRYTYGISKNNSRPKKRLDLSI